MNIIFCNIVKEDGKGNVNRRITRTIGFFISFILIMKILN